MVPAGPPLRKWLSTTGFVRPQLALVAARVGQAFALVLTIVGFTLVLTVGPTITFDVTMHLTMLATLVVGLAIAARATRFGPGRDLRTGIAEPVQ